MRPEIAYFMLAVSLPLLHSTPAEADYYLRTGDVVAEVCTWLGVAESCHYEAVVAIRRDDGELWKLGSQFPDQLVERFTGSTCFLMDSDPSNRGFGGMLRRRLSSSGLFARRENGELIEIDYPDNIRFPCEKHPGEAAEKEAKRSDPERLLSWLGTRSAIAEACAERVRGAPNADLYLEWIGYSSEIDRWIGKATERADPSVLIGYYVAKQGIKDAPGFRTEIGCDADDRKEIKAALSYIEATPPETMARHLFP